MENCSEKEIMKLQDNLQFIRKAGGWSAQEFGDMIGVTKQTISNLENKKTAMSKTQYIAIRAVLDYEMAKRPDDKVLSSTVNLALNSDDLSEEDRKKAQAFVEGATKTKLDNNALIGGLAAILGAVAAEALTMTLTTTGMISVTEKWLEKILKNK